MDGRQCGSPTMAWDLRGETHSSLEDGHIGMASTRTKVLAAEGLFDVRATSPGTE